MEIFEVAIGFLEMLLAKYGKALPLAVVEALHKAVEELVKHKDDPLTKENFEKLRG